MVASQKYAITGWLMALQPLFDVYKYSVFVELLLLFSISIPEVLLGASFLKYKMLIVITTYLYPVLFQIVSMLLISSFV